MDVYVCSMNMLVEVYDLWVEVDILSMWEVLLYTRVKYCVQFLVHACSVAYVPTVQLREIVPIGVRYFALAGTTTHKQRGALRVSAHSR